jgi:hypothetical protein
MTTASPSVNKPRPCRQWHYFNRPVNMALFMGNSLAKGGILDLSEAEAAFYPWWDQLQDYATYTSILIGN